MNRENKTAHLQKLIAKRHQNIQYLEAQAAKYGVLSVPLEIHNQLLDEKAALEALQANLEQSQSRRPLAGPAAARFIVVENDVYWREIIIEAATVLGYQSTPFHPTDLMSRTDDLPLADHCLSIISLPTADHFAPPFSLKKWTVAITKLAQTMPVILLTSGEATPVSLATRHTLRKYNRESAATIQKETFNYNWFLKMIRKAIDSGAADENISSPLN